MLALSATDVLLVVGLGAVGFIVIALVCVGVLAMLQLILPASDAGAAEVDRLHAAAEAGSAETDAPVDV